MTAPTGFVTAHGDPDALDSVILRTLAGSGVHGIAIEGRDDRDEIGVYIERPDTLFAPGKHIAGHFTGRTQPEGARSGPGDLDLSLYSLRRYLDLIAKGHPTALIPLWVPDGDIITTTPWGEQLRGLRHHFITLSAGRRFLGYLDGQIDKMQGNARGAPYRPELISAYGYDTKFASHALRLALQGQALLAAGELPLPLPPDERDAVLLVKNGRVSLATALAMVNAARSCLEGILGKAIHDADWPEHVSHGWLVTLSRETHLNYWRERAWV